MNKFVKIFLLSITFAIISVPAFSDSDESQADDKYLHEHEGNEVAHDLRMAMIEFEPTKITDYESQFLGKWKLANFESTDPEMLHLVTTRQMLVSLDVYNDYLQVSVTLASNGKVYKDPPVEFHILDEVIYLENDDFAIGLIDEFLILTLVAMDEGFRYVFERE
jgi:hypothetical protein